MRVCDRCRRPGELVVALQDAMTNPIELCPSCTSDFFEWVAAGVRKTRSDKGQARSRREATCSAPVGMFAEQPTLPPMNDFPAAVEAAE